MGPLKISRRSVLAGAAALVLPVGGIGVTMVIGPSTGSYGPDHEFFDYTDHSGVVVDGERARFLRPVSYQDYEHCAPGSRVRLRSDAPTVTLRLRFNNLNDASAYQDVIGIYVDGVSYSDHNPADSRTVFDYDITLSFGSSQPRTIEIIMPYSAGVDFLGVMQDSAYRLFRPLNRPTTKLLAIGDSITQGFNATDARRSWPFLLAQAKGWQLVNMGYGGGRTETHSDAADYIADINPDKAVVMIGVNNFSDQTPLVTFKADYESLLTTLLTDTSAPILAVTPTWLSNSSGTISLASYRTAIGEVVAALDDDRITLVNGLTLGTNSTAHFPDGVHPNDACSAAIATGLGLII